MDTKYEASVYAGMPHPLIPFDKGCAECKAHCQDVEGVPSAGPDDLTNIKLIVISDYPGKYEVEFGWPQVPNSLALAQQKSKKKLPPIPNSGQLIRDLIEQMFGLCSYSEVWFTNAIRCDPNHGQDSVVVSDRIIKTCNKAWGLSEFYLLDKYVPKVPILAAGTKALRCLQLIYGEECPQGSINSYLRRTDLIVKEHPLVCCNNPAVYARSVGRIESSINLSRRGDIDITAVTNLSNYMLTPLEHFKQDIKVLSTYIANI
jgi:hypothetical protein